MREIKVQEILEITVHQKLRNSQSREKHEIKIVLSVKSLIKSLKLSENRTKKAKAYSTLGIVKNSQK